MNYTQEDLDKALNNFLNKDLCKKTDGQLERMATFDWNKKVQNTDYKSFQNKRIANTNFDKRNAKIDQKARTAKINYKANASKVDWVATRAKGVANTDYEARTAKIDYAAKVANMDYNARNKKIDWEERNKKLMKPISQFDKQGNFIKDWNSSKQAAQELNLFPECITACLKGRQKTVGKEKFIFKYKLEQN
jgi:hypothetical protein